MPFKSNIKTKTNAHAVKVEGKNNSDYNGFSWIKLDIFEF